MKSAFPFEEILKEILIREAKILMKSTPRTKTVIEDPNTLVNQIIYIPNFFIERPVADATRVEWADSENYFGAIVAAVTLAAATALTVAKELLQKDLQNLTDRYLQLMDDKKEKILELGNIDLDEETANFFMERLKLVSEGMILTL